MDTAAESVSSVLPPMLVTARLIQQLVPDAQLRRRESKTTDLCSELRKTLQSGRFSDALDLYELIEKRKPDEPRWAHRKGDLLRRMGRTADAVLAYERAVHLYSDQGFDARAAATAKLVLAIDPGKVELLEWVDAQAASKGQQQSRNGFHLTY